MNEAEAIFIKREFEREFAKDFPWPSWLQGYGLGKDTAGNYTINVYTSNTESAKETLPTVYRGLNVLLCKTSEFIAQKERGHRESRRHKKIR